MTEQSTKQLPADAPQEGAVPALRTLKSLDRFDPVETSGTSNARFAHRLAEQVAICQVIPGDGTDAADKVRAESTTSAIATLTALAPANAIEALIATQAVAAHNAGLDLLNLALQNRRNDRLVDSFVRQHARLANVTLRSLDQLVRLRGRQKQTIGIEHVRVSDDGKVTLRQEEERVRG